jgi:hypothetical protein
LELSVQQTRNDTVRGLCIECSMRRHAFNELTGRCGRTDHFDQIHLPEALIDGRRHILLSYVWTRQETCTDCNQATPTLYVPMK